MRSFARIVVRDVRLALLQGSAGTMAIGFFVIVTVLFPLGVGPELKVLARISAGGPVRVPIQATVGVEFSS